LKTSIAASATPQEVRWLDVDGLKVPATELWPAIQDAVAVAEDFIGRAERSLIDHQPCPLPRMLAVILYCYLRGIHGSVEIEEAFRNEELVPLDQILCSETRDGAGHHVRVIAGPLHPNRIRIHGISFSRRVRRSDDGRLSDLQTSA
jgi:hypothetical protein